MKRIFLAMIAVIVAQAANAETTFDSKYKFELKEITSTGQRVVESFEIATNPEKPSYLSHNSTTNSTSKCDAVGNPIAWQPTSSGLTATIEPIVSNSQQHDDMKLINVKIKYSRLVALETKRFGNCTLGIPTVVGFNVEATLSLDKINPTLLNKLSNETGSYEMWVTSK